MSTNNIISRTSASALIPIPVAQDIQKSVIEMSAALNLFRTIQMSSKTMKMPVLSALPTASWVAGDTGLKQTTEVNWADKTLVVEELAVIVPIPEAVLDDSAFDIWGEVRPLIAEAIGRALDAAIFFGTNKPASWPSAIIPAAIAAGNARARGTATIAQGGIAEDVNQLMGMVEDDGYDVTGFATQRGFRSRLRGARSTDGVKLMDVSTDQLDGNPVAYTMSGLWPSGLSAAELIAGDFTRGILGVRQDITYKLFDQGVISSGANAIEYNLMQQDMVALRVVARYAFEVANPINYSNGVEANRYPFAVLRSPAA